MKASIGIQGSLRGGTCALALFALSAGASAQTVAPDTAPAQDVSPGSDATAPADQSGDIIVTAQKRSQRLQDVGLSITAQTGEQLQTAGIRDVSSLNRVVPALSIGRSQFGYPIISMRGVNLNLPYLSAQPTVSTYVDQALLAYPAMTQGIFLDVERIEVLKGPQGTLFGANVTGGAINIIAAKPTSTAQAGFRVEVNQFGGTHLEGFVSGPVTSNLNARLAASTDQFGAWQKCYFACTTKNGDANRGAARLLLDWTPTDTLKVALNVNGNYDHGEPQQFQIKAKAINFLPGAPGYADYPLPPRDNRAADFNFPAGQRDHSRDRTLQSVLRVDLDLGFTTLTSLTNYADTKRFANFDGDGSVLPLGFNQTFGRIKSFNQEVRISGKLDTTNLNYVLGASYQKDKILDGQSAQWFGYSGIPFGADAIIRNPVGYRSYGVFGSADWEFTPGLTVTAGGRYAWQRETTGGCFADGGSGQLAGIFGFVSSQFRAASGLGPAAPGTFGPGKCFALDNRPEVLGTAGAYLPYEADLSQSERNFSWKLGLNYKATRDILIYGLVSRGYKAGSITPGYNTVATQFARVKQEQLTAYEIGVKSSFADNAVVLNAAVFYYDYRDKQFSSLELGAIGDQVIVVNIPKSKVKGAEADLTIRPAEGLTLHGAVAYVDSKVGEYTSYIGLGQFQNIKGTAFNLAPKWGGNFDINYRAPVNADLTGFVGGSGMFNSSTYGTLGQSPSYFIPAYKTFDARVGVESSHGWTATLFVRNLTDKYYINNVTSGNDATLATAGLPRTYGASIALKW
jgi:iron complex outermembrane receptor protein